MPVQVWGKKIAGFRSMAHTLLVVGKELVSNAYHGIILMEHVQNKKSFYII